MGDFEGVDFCSAGLAGGGSGALAGKSDVRGNTASIGASRRHITG